MCCNNKDLRDELTDYFGTAMCSGNPAAMMDLIQVQEASDEELVSIARENGFDASFDADDCAFPYFLL